MLQYVAQRLRDLPRAASSNAGVRVLAAAARAGYHGVAAAALVDEEGWRTDGESFDRRESERLAVSHAHNSPRGAHQ